MSKKLFLNILCLLAVISSVNCDVLAVPQEIKKAETVTIQINSSDLKDEESDFIKKFSLRNKLQRSPQTQIKNFYKKFNKYSDNNEIEKLKELYSDDYVNNDGFNKSTIFEMILKAQDVYKDVENTMTLDSIVTDGKYAAVDVHEFSIGTTAKKQKSVGDYGLVSSDLYYTDYLEKKGNKWQITSSNVKSEKVALKYGEAKNMPIEISAPLYVPENSEYEVKITTQPPNGVMVIGSIVNENIVYPQVTEKDIFKSVKSGVIERILKSNKNNTNEYAAVTIGLTRATIEPPEVVFTMTGMAFVMSRINVLHKNSSDVIEKENKNESETSQE